MAQLNNLIVTGDARFLNPIKGVAETLQGTCSTPQGTAQKDVTVTNNITFSDNNLVPGVNISVKFTNSNTHGTPTLKVGTATAKGIMRYGTTKPGGLPNNSWHAGAVVLFTYDGTYWVMNDNNDGLEQSLTSSNWKLPLLLSYAGNTDTTTSIVNKSYRNNSIYANPSTGGIYCSQINGVTIPSTPDFSNTHRPIKVNGTQILGDNTTPLNLAAGTEISLTNSSGTVTIDATTHTTVNDTTLEISNTTYSNDSVSQTNTTTNANYRVLLSHSADSNTETAGVYKNQGLYFNTSSGILYPYRTVISDYLTTPKLNGFTCGPSLAEFKAALGIKDLLWENTNAFTSAFAAQTVSINLSGYSEIIIDYVNYKNNGSTAYSNEIRSSGLVVGKGATYLISVLDTFYRRSATVTTSGVTFSGAYQEGTYNNWSGSWGIDNNAVVPYRIWGWNPPHLAG